jgi:uncharacterized protein Yka (UPF0111/DUF47 family)
MFAQLAAYLTETARLIGKLFAEPQRLEVHAAAIKEVEHRADNLTHDVISRIDKSFVTPIDREDIHLLTTSLDDVIDLIDGAARRAEMYRITESRRGAKELCDVLLRAADCIQAGVGEIRRSRLVSERNQQVRKLEEEGDAIYHDAMGALFHDSPDPLDVIKWKDIYDKLEDAIDRCEDVANTLESISLKHA